MNITLTKQDELNAILSVEIAPEDYDDKVRKQLNDLAKKVNIKGFRPGKVPVDVVKRMYGKSVLVDVINDTLSNAINDYIDSNKLPLLGNPMPADDEEPNQFELNQSFKFKFDLGIAPEFALPKLADMTIDAFRPEVDSAFIDDQISQIQQRYGNNEEVEAAAAGDNVYGNVKKQGTNDKPVATVLRLKEVKAGSEVQFFGKKKGDVVVFNIHETIEESALRNFLNLKADKSSEGIEGAYEIEIEQVGRVKPAELDEELFKKLGNGIEDELGLRNKVEEEVEVASKQDGEYYQRQALKKQIIDGLNFELPDAFLKRWLLSANENKLTEAQVEEQYPNYVKELKFSLFMGKIGEMHDLQVSTEEVMDFVREDIRGQFARFGMADLTEEQVNQYANNYLKGRSNEERRRLFDNLFENKVFAFIYQQVTVVDQPIARATFEEKVKALNA